MRHAPGALEFAGCQTVHFIAGLPADKIGRSDMAGHHRQRRFVNDIATAVDQIESLHGQAAAGFSHQMDGSVVAENEFPSFVVCEVGFGRERHQFAAVLALCDLKLSLPIT